MTERNEYCPRETEPCEFPKCLLTPYDDKEAYYCSYREEKVLAEHPGECKDCPKCKHPECRHGFGLCDYARDCACDYYVGKAVEK